MNKAVAIIVVLVVLGGGWWLMNRDVSTDNSAAGTQEEGTPYVGPDTVTSNADASTSAATSTATNIKEFTVTAGSFFFSPKTLSVNKGDTVKITVTNSGGMHDFVLDEFNVRSPRLNAGQSATVTFVASKSGTFEYYCSVGTHRQMGMVGTLTVK